jgi:diketogulonate reductase-like aldo/keto reductase
VRKAPARALIRYSARMEPLRQGTLAKFGPLPDEVPIVGQGTWMMGDRGVRAEDVETLRRGIALGLRHIDTAELYGPAEEMVGEAIRGIPRRDLFLVSKVLPQHASRAGTIRACEATLRRVGTDYLDVYLLHWRGPHPLAETMAALETLVEQGKIRALGVSNFDVEDLEEASGLLTRARIACNQVLYNLEQRYADLRLVDSCARLGIAVVGYSPFGHGDFPGPRTAGGRALARVAARYEATPRQVALAFLTRRPPLFTIPKASSAAHVEENAGALTLRLDEADVAAIDAAFPVPRGARDLPML